MGKATVDNPFRVPQELESNLFELRKEEQQRKIEIEEKIDKKSVRSKADRSALAHESNALNTSKSSLHDAASRQNSSLHSIYRDNDVLSRHAPDGKMTVSELISKKREMLLLNMKIRTQHEQIEKLHQQLKSREDALKSKEASLDDSIQRFDLLLKETEERARNTQRLAEKETAKRVKKQQELSVVTNQLQAVQSDIARHTNALDELHQYKQFLDSLTPPSWSDDRLADKRKRQHQRRRDRINARKEAFQKEQQEIPKQKAEADAIENRASSARRRTRKTAVEPIQPEEQKTIPTPDFEDEPLTSSDEECPMYFERPAQLLDQFTDLENENLLHIKMVQERESYLRTLKSKIKELTEDLESKADVSCSECVESIDAPKQNLGDGQSSRRNYNRTQAQLAEKIEEVYQACDRGTSTSTSLDLLFMLSEIEATMENLLSKIEEMPPAWVAKKLNEKKNEARTLKWARQHADAKKPASKDKK